jgi:hypothetical protein
LIDKRLILRQFNRYFGSPATIAEKNKTRQITVFGKSSMTKNVRNNERLPAGGRRIAAKFMTVFNAG